VLPVLPHSIKRLHAYLATAPLHVRNGLLHAIYALTAVDSHPRTPPSPHTPPSPPAHIHHTLKACDLLGSEAFVPDDGSHTGISRNLLHMQTLLLLALNADKRAFSPPQVSSAHSMPIPPLQEHGYTSRFVSSMIGAAWGCANEMKLGEAGSIIRKRTHAQMENAQDPNADVDGEVSLGRRAWWILVILDRWRSSSTSMMPLIADDKIYLRDSDQNILGDVAYHLVRVSCVLGHIGEVPSSTPETRSNLAQVGRFLNGEIERVRETAEPAMEHDALLNVAVWYRL
jgi:hypothetical protein